MEKEVNPNVTSTSTLEINSEFVHDLPISSMHEIPNVPEQCRVIIEDVNSESISSEDFGAVDNFFGYSYQQFIYNVANKIQKIPNTRENIDVSSMISANPAYTQNQGKSISKPSTAVHRRKTRSYIHIP